MPRNTCSLADPISRDKIFQEKWWCLSFLSTSQHSAPHASLLIPTPHPLKYTPHPPPHILMIPLDRKAVINMSNNCGGTPTHADKLLRPIKILFKICIKIILKLYRNAHLDCLRVLEPNSRSYSYSLILSEYRSAVYTDVLVKARNFPTNYDRYRRELMKEPDVQFHWVDQLSPALSGRRGVMCQASVATDRYQLLNQRHGSRVHIDMIYSHWTVGVWSVTLDMGLGQSSQSGFIRVPPERSQDSNRWLY